MFWFALELTNPKMGLIIKLSFIITKLNALKCNGVMNFDNIGLETDLRQVWLETALAKAKTDTFF